MYRLIRFGRTSIEYYNQVEPVGSGATATAYSLLAEGGALDLFGDQDKHPGMVERVKSMRLQAASQGDLAEIYFTLLALRGKRERLYRRTMTGAYHWQYARLVEVAAQNNYELAQFKRLQDMDLRFACPEATWRGALGGTWHLDAGEYLDDGLFLDSEKSADLDASPTVFTVACGEATDPGRAPVRALRIVVYPGDAAMSDISIERTGGETLEYDGSLASGETLVIDTGLMQVTVDDVDAYDNLVLAPTADMAAWFTLQPGDNVITVTFTGGGTGAKIDFLYYEAWY